MKGVSNNMSNRELALSIINQMSEEKILAFLALFSDENMDSEASDDLSVQKDFVQKLKLIKEYRLSLQDKTREELVDGVIYDILSMIDGEAGINNFHSLKIVDMENGERIDCGYLHEIYYYK